jgi:hypothetical protein
MEATVHLGDLPTWLAAVGTVGALAAALIQIGNERKNRLAVAERQEFERHQAQARLIAAYLGSDETRGRPGATSRQDEEAGEGRTPINIVNSSSEPVYRLVVGVVFVQGAGPRSIEAFLSLRRDNPEQRLPITTATVLPGGTWRVWIAGTGWSAILSGRASAEVAFTDRSGAHWIRRGTGALEELAEEPLEYFKRWELYGPYEFQTPEPIAY